MKNITEENTWRIYVLAHGHIVIAKSDNPCAFAGWVHTELSATIIRYRTGTGIEGMAKNGPTENCQLSDFVANVSIPISSIIQVIHDVNLNKWKRHFPKNV